jgi:hypothetical protein
MTIIKVWHDWDSGPYETISTKKIGNHPHSEMLETDYQEYQEVLRRYDYWQKKLYEIRKKGEIK